MKRLTVFLLNGMRVAFTIGEAFEITTGVGGIKSVPSSFNTNPSNEPFPHCIISFEDGSVIDYVGIPFIVEDLKKAEEKKAE